MTGQFTAQGVNRALATLAGAQPAAALKIRMLAVRGVPRYYVWYTGPHGATLETEVTTLGLDGIE